MSFPRYPAYKPSGVEWLGEVPEHWGILPVKRVASLQSGTGITSDFISEDATYPVFGGNGVRGFTDSFTHNGCFPIIGRQGALCGNINYANGTFWASEHAVVVSPVKHCEVRWLGETLRAMNLSQYSISAAQPGLSVEMINTLMMPCPPQKEQTAIATFLDRETAKIDALIAEQQRLIELLQEKRQAVISHAVTKGLNPDTPMKDSGVEWLGEVPEHWEITKLKRITRQISVGIVVEPSKYYDDEGEVPALRSLNVKPGQIDIEDCVYINGRSSELLSKSILRAGDLVLVRTGQPGTCAVVPESLDACNCIDLIFVRKPYKGCSDYLMYQLSSDAARHQYDLGSDGAIQQHFNVKTATSLIIAWPTHDEQHAISSYLNATLAKLDYFIETTSSTVLLLQERRSALISAAVTGQIDVRGLVPEADGQ
jgi:type I restriction enzyme S subunit